MGNFVSRSLQYVLAQTVVFPLEYMSSWSATFSGALRSLRNSFRHLALGQTNKINMDITRDNFEEKLPLVLKSIQDAEFIAIDGEMTGISDGKSGINAFDTPKDRYIRAQGISSQFLLVQFGLCTFHYDQPRDVYTYRAFNFYVWPRPSSRNAPDIRFGCQSSSMDFLTTHNFDFNKLFQQGISYLSQEQEMKLRAEVLEKQRQRRSESQAQGDSGGSSLNIPEEQREYMEQVIAQIEDFRSKPSEMADDSVLELARSSPFQRRLVFQTVKDRYSDLYAESVVSEKEKGSPRVVRLTKTTGDEIKRMEAVKDAEELNKVENAAGFSHVIRELSKAQKLIVGHNMLLDLCFTMNQFVAALPEDYESFRTLVSQTFPRLADTKLIASTYPFKEDIPSTTLEDMKSILRVEPFSLPEVKPADAGVGYEDESDRYHEAGYDAYITGLCFLGLANRLGQLSQDKDSKHPMTGKPRVPPSSPLLSPFLNKLFLMRIQDIPYMNLSDEDINPDRAHVFHLEMPSEWKTSDIISLFAPFGNVFIAWINDTSAFVSLHNKEFAPQVVCSLTGSNTYKITPYKKFKALAEMDATTSSTTTGITPMFEKTTMFTRPFGTSCTTPTNSLHKKRTLRADEDGGERAAVKRTKSVTEEVAKPEQVEKKLFQENSAWE